MRSTNEPVVTADAGRSRQFFHTDSKVKFASVEVDLIDKVHPVSQEIVVQISEATILDDH